MKKITIFLLIVLFPLITLADLKGDVNGNGCLDSNDYVLIRKYLLGTITLTNEQYQRAKTTDRDVGSQDYIYIRKALLASPGCQTTVPIDSPTIAPVVTITEKPTVAPTKAPVVTITEKPTVAPTKAPVVTITEKPTVAPTKAPVVTATQKPTATATQAPTAAPSLTVSIGITKLPCKAILEAKVEGSASLASKAYSWDDGKTWTNDKKLTVTKTGTYKVSVKDSNNKIYSSEYQVKDLVSNNLKNGIINVNEVNIVSGTDVTKEIATANLTNLNDAMQCAANNGIKSLKITKGAYQFGVTNKNHITIPANTTLDLNNSKFYVYPNGNPSATLFEIINENVTIKNGVLKGDKYGHICEGGEWKVLTSSKGNTGCRCHIDETAAGNSHENNHGISIKSTGAVIDNLKITEMMGDGVLISSPTNISSDKKQIKIINSTIDNCRRNGISIIQGENILINNNIITNTNGTAPQHGIDIEANAGMTYKKITISNNTIYGNGSHRAIMIFYRTLGDNPTVTITGTGKDGITINNNHLGDYMFYHRLPNENVVGGKGSTGKAITVYDNDTNGIPIGTTTPYGETTKNCVCNANSLDSACKICSNPVVKCCSAKNVCSQ